MAVVLIILAFLIFLFLCWVLSLYCVRDTDNFRGLAAYPYAHRGLHAKDAGVPENSLKAFRLAVGHGYGAELDVRLTRDGHLVIMHDSSLLRTCGVDRIVEKSTADDLSKYRLGGTDEKIPLLEEVLPLFEGKRPLVIEIKAVGANYARLTGKVCKLLQDYPDLQFCIEAFDPRVIYWLRKNRPDIVRGQLSCILRNGEADYLSKPAKFLLANLVTNFLTRPNFIAYRLEDRKTLAMQICKKLWGVREVNWTVQTQADTDEALADGRSVIFEGFLPN